MERLNYSTLSTPAGYACLDCGARGVKLWRRYQTFLEHQELRCGSCALKNQNETGPIGEDGRRASRYAKTDQIGWLVPAVPTENCETFWGYTSVPQDGVEWWRRLPLTTAEKGGE